MLPPELINRLKEKLGKDEALEIIKLLDEKLSMASSQKKPDLKEVLTKAEFKEEIIKLKEEISELQEQMAELKAQITELRFEIAEAREEFSSQSSEIKRLEGYIKALIVLLLLAIILYSPLIFELVRPFLRF